MAPPLLLHGVPAHEWVGRMVKLNSRDAPGNARNPAKITAVNEDKKTATVHPGGHRGTEEIPFSAIHPWWSRNDDLRRKYFVPPGEAVTELLDDIAATCRSVAQSGKSLANEAYQTALTHIPAIIQAPPPIPVMTHQAKPSVPPPAAPGPARAIRRIIVDPSASISWMEDYKALQDALKDVHDKELMIAAAHEAHEKAKDTVETFIQALDGTGVQIEWNEPAKPEAGPATHGVTALEIKRINQWRARLKAQMNPGRVYSREQLIEILQEKDNGYARRTLGKVFSGHKHFMRKMNGPGNPATYTIVP